VAKKLGNDYRLWIESATPGTFTQIAGQQSLTYNRSSQQIDISDKNNAPYALSAAGLFAVDISVQGLADLPDANGFTLMETKFKAQASWKFQIRKNGSSGADPADVVFAATCNILELPLTFPQNGGVGYSAKLGLALAPTVDALA
jgi:predicted secreted protein